jgi:hypothetical protein
MKKIVIFEAMFFLFLSFAFADKNLNKLENTDFNWQSKTDFIHLNPVFFHDNNYSLMDLLENNSRLLNMENNQIVSNNAQETTNSFGGLLFFITLFAEMITPLDLNPFNQQNHEIYDNFIEQQKQERLYRGLFHGIEWYYGVYGIY